jgi:hypothetical protein
MWPYIHAQGWKSILSHIVSRSLLILLFLVLLPEATHEGVVVGGGRHGHRLRAGALAAADGQGVQLTGLTRSGAY